MDNRKNWQSLLISNTFDEIDKELKRHNLDWTQVGTITLWESKEISVKSEKLYADWMLDKKPYNPSGSFDEKGQYHDTDLEWRFRKGK